jgi:hypothetical protein
LVYLDVFGSVVYLLAVNVYESVNGYGEKADDKPGIRLAIHTPNPNITTI